MTRLDTALLKTVHRAKDRRGPSFPLSFSLSSALSLSITIQFFVSQRRANNESRLVSAIFHPVPPELSCQRILATAARRRRQILINDTRARDRHAGVHLEKDDRSRFSACVVVFAIIPLFSFQRD